MKIVLATINARYSHTSFGLRYLKANLHEFEHETEICEFSLDESVQEIAEKIIGPPARYCRFWLLYLEH